MAQTILQKFQHALGVRHGIHFSVRSLDGATFTLKSDSPCAVIGRTEHAQLRLDDDTVAYRHAYLQAIGNRLACVDLFSPNTVTWADGGTHDWVHSQRPFRVGRFALRTDTPWEAADSSVLSPFDVRPGDPSAREYGVLPQVRLHLINKALAGTSWPINRVLTLVGRDERCRITCSDETVSRVHCSLVLLPSGLWIVDLLGKGGTSVDGVTGPVLYLGPGSVLGIGRYRMQAEYLTPPAVLPPPRLERVEFLTRLHRIFPISWDGDTLIVSPQGQARDFRYQDIQVEGNCILTILRTFGFKNVLIDFSDVKLCGSIILDSIIQFCRSVTGSAALCNCSPEQKAALDQLKLSSLWPLYDDREIAICALRSANIAQLVPSGTGE